MWQLIAALPTSLWLQISHSINKEESSIREGLKKSNLEGDTEGENLQEQENNNKLLNEIKKKQQSQNNRNNASWGWTRTHPASIGYLTKTMYHVT